MGYSYALSQLMILSNQEFSNIPECNDAVIVERDTSKIVCKEQAWLYELTKSISPSSEGSGQMQRPWPKYRPRKALWKGGEAFLLTAWDAWKQQLVLLKVPLPIFSLQRVEPKNAKSPDKQGLVQGARALLAIGKDLCRPKPKRLEPPKKDQPKQDNKFDLTRDVTRFRRSFTLQKQLHQIARRHGSDLGYIPDVYEFGESPNCYYSMEFVAGTDWMDWIRNHSDVENLELYGKLIVLLEKVLHGYGVAHCDLAPRNVLVMDGKPVLLDFGIAKTANLPEITVDSAQLGSILMASASQLEDSKNRGFQDDIFSMGRMLWITLARSIPSLEGIVAREEDSGRIEYDAEAVAALFDQYAIPEKFRGVFQSTQKFEFEDISDFRTSFEGLIYLDQPAQQCGEKCQALLALESKLVEIAEILAGIKNSVNKAASDGETK